MQFVYIYSMFSPFLIYGFLSLKRNTSREQKYKLLLTLYAIQSAIIIGTRGLETGADTFQYYLIYTRISQMRSITEVFHFDFETLFTLTGYICSRLHMSSVGFNIVIAGLTMLFFSMGVYKSSKSPLLSLYIYNCFALYAQMFNQVRQMLAMAIILYAVAKLTEGNKRGFILLIIVATLFHTSSIICISLYFVYNRKITYKLIFIYFLSGVAIAIANRTILMLISRYFHYGHYLSESWRYSSYDRDAIANTIVRIIMIALAMLFFREIIENNEKMNVVYHMVIICTILQVLCIFNNAMGRITTPFFYGYLILIPEITTTKFFNTSKNKLVLYPLLILLLFAYYTVRTWNSSYMTYSSQWLM